jgi:hypothetical protein
VIRASWNLIKENTKASSGSFSPDSLILNSKSVSNPCGVAEKINEQLPPPFNLSDLFDNSKIGKNNPRFTKSMFLFPTDPSEIITTTNQNFWYLFLSWS